MSEGRGFGLHKEGVTGEQRTINNEKTPVWIREPVEGPETVQVEKTPDTPGRAEETSRTLSTLEGRPEVPDTGEGSVDSWGGNTKIVLVPLDRGRPSTQDT